MYINTAQGLQHLLKSETISLKNVILQKDFKITTFDLLQKAEYSKLSCYTA